MKSKKAREVLARSYDGGHICMENAERAIEIAEQETEERIRQKAHQIVKEMMGGIFHGDMPQKIADEFIQKLNDNENEKGLYQRNKDAKVGEMIECPVCHTKFTKRQYSQAFCCGHCKDKFHNMRCKDRHRYKVDWNNEMTDHDWDEAFGVAEFNVAN